MDSLDIQVVDSLTVNLNQEDYSTEGQILNDIAVYVEDEQLLFDAALTLDSINLYTRETPDIISFDTKGIMDGISKLESLIEKTSKEATLLAKVAELKEALNTIDFTAIEQAVQNVENITAKEATLIQGVSDIIKAVENIDFTDLENSIAEVKNAVVNIDLSALAKEETLKQGVQEIKGYVENIDFSAIAKENTLLVESKVIKDKIDAIEIPVTDLTEVAKENTLVQGIASISQKVDNIVIPEVDTTPLAKEDTLTQGVNTISQKIDDIHMPELDKSDLAKEATLSSGISTLSNKIDNIDLSSVENKVDEVKQAVENIDLTPIENKVQEGVNTLSSRIDNIDLSAVENKVQEESAAIQTKIDNIQLPEIDTTELAKESTLNAVSSKLDNLNVEVDLSSVAKQGENQDATNTAIYALLSQFGESVLQEKVTVILNCQDNIAWQDYAVNVTFEDGRVQAVPLSENGTCSFSIKIGQTYSVQLPVIGIFIAPELKTYTAISSAREIYWSYVAMGVFGMDELGRRYSIEQIEALEDKSIIKYGGFTDEYLENCKKEDGTYGCGFMWKIGGEQYSGSDKRWSYPSVEFSQELLPFLTSNEMAITHCDGESYTRYMISESARLGAVSVAAFCKKQSITIGGEIKNGFLPAYGQLRRLVLNISLYDRLYIALGVANPDIDSAGMNWWTSCQASATQAVYLRSGKFTMSIAKDNPGAYTFLAFPLS